ncbi:MAG: glycosyltransferase [Syntrophobacteraceae bacterium]|nr:glycosyltransferase [Syntrophobacteraceae bacterium]
MRANITVCVATYKRPAGLARLLDSLANQEAGGPVYRIAVVDNDREGSGGGVVEKFRLSKDMEAAYEIEPERGIAPARNRSVRLAGTDFVAFVDDDEVVCTRWLRELYECALRNEADAVLGPVVPAFPAESPDWVVKGRFFERPGHQNDALVERGRTGNVLVKKKWLDLFATPFDLRLGLRGDEDSDFFERIRSLGARFYWAEKAVVTEYVEKDRLSVRWVLKRAFRGGQGFACRHMPQGAPGRVWHYVCRGCLCLLSLALTCVTLPFALHISVGWLRRAFSNLGQISVIFPYRYEEYRNR